MLWLVLMSMSLHAFAQVAGTVTQLSGPMMAKKPDGKIKVLSLKSEVESGDTLVTEKNTYALVKFIDDSEITLKPATTFVVEQFAYQAGQPDGDRASFNLIKGGLRSLSGLLGKRNKEKFSLKTPVATIGIRGTFFIAEYVAPSTPAPASLAPTVPTQGMPPGLYVQVLDGLINLTNPAGTLNFSAGQFGYTPSFKQPPVLVPTNPGMQFTPPPVFNASTGPTASNSNPGKSNSVDCEVR